MRFFFSNSKTSLKVKNYAGFFPFFNHKENFSIFSITFYSCSGWNRKLLRKARNLYNLYCTEDVRTYILWFWWSVYWNNFIYILYFNSSVWDPLFLPVTQGGGGLFDTALSSGPVDLGSRVAWRNIVVYANGFWCM